MPVTRPRSAADVRREIASTEQRVRELHARWLRESTTAQIGEAGPSRDDVDRVEEVLRLLRGGFDRLHQLWIEYAQMSGLHAPQ